MTGTVLLPPKGFICCIRRLWSYLHPSVQCAGLVYFAHHGSKGSVLLRASVLLVCHFPVQWQPHCDSWCCLGGGRQGAWCPSGRCSCCSGGLSSRTPEHSQGSQMSPYKGKPQRAPPTDPDLSPWKWGIVTWPLIAYRVPFPVPFPLTLFSRCPHSGAVTGPPV